MWPKRSNVTMIPAQRTRYAAQRICGFQYLCRYKIGNIFQNARVQHNMHGSNMHLPVNDCRQNDSGMKKNTLYVIVTVT